MMKPYDKITATELKAIEDYVLNYAAPEYCGNKKYLAEWDKKKENLFKLMGDNLILPIGSIIHSPTAIDRQKSLEDISVREMFTGLKNEIISFAYYYFFSSEEKKFLKTYSYNNGYFAFDMKYSTLPEDENAEKYRREILKKVRRAYDFEREYEDWKYVQEFSTETEYIDSKFKIGAKGRTMRMSHKEKKIKALNRFYHLMEMEVAEDTSLEREKRVELLKSLKKHIKQLENLMSLNINKTISSNIILSIHPLDFMTMSDNDSNWTSCMSWRDFGSYRSGTVEMMNSASIIIAYSKAEKSMNLLEGSDKYKWNNKTWRELFIVTKDFIYPIKGYPYHSKEFEEFVITKIAELGEKNCGFKYREDFCKGVSPLFLTNNMYNDTTYRISEEIGKLSMNLTEEEVKEISFNYSGDFVGAVSGDIAYLDPDYETGLLANATDCPYYKCPHCGEIITYDTVSWNDYDGEYVCDNCYTEIEYEEEDENC